MTVVSLSEIWSFQECKRRYYYSYGLGLRAIEQATAIDDGTIGHKLLEGFYKSLQEDATKEEARVAMTNWLDQSEKDRPETIKVYALVLKYIDSLKLKGHPLLVEAKEKVSLVDAFGISAGFTDDLVWEYPDGFCDIEDYKFVVKKWSNDKMKRYSQLKFYMLFRRLLGYNVSRGVLRLFNKQTHEIHTRTYDVNPIELDRLKKEFILNAIDVQEFKEKPVAEMESLATRTVNYTVCANCPFRHPCQMELEGKDTSTVLSHMFTQNTYGYEE